VDKKEDGQNEIKWVDDLGSTFVVVGNYNEFYPLSKLVLIYIVNNYST
jgi:hypothetical protein